MKRGQRPFRLQKKRMLNILLAALLVLVFAKAFWGKDIPGLSRHMPKIREATRLLGQNILENIWKQFYPAPDLSGQDRYREDTEEDPAYRTSRAVERFLKEHEYLALYGNEETGGTDTGTAWAEKGRNGEEVKEEKGQIKEADAGALLKENGTDAEPALNASSAFPGQVYQLAQLEDYDFLMSHFYSVHTSTTADRQLMDVKRLLSRNFVLQEPEETEEGRGMPQILIYHTHSQEAFADSADGQNIVAVGEYLTELLAGKGFSVYHDRSVYDVQDGKLDRNKAYTYALEGISRILDEYPSIQVVIDLHRDGVREGTRLVTEIGGKPTAQIMFFNGLSQTPTGPVPYLDNPNLEDNLAFSLQLQLKAAAYFPGFTRKIYLKGLRYNLHVRPAACLVEAGAQTNTYEEVKNAMEPLAEVLTMVLRGN